MKFNKRFGTTLQWVSSLPFMGYGENLFDDLMPEQQHATSQSNTYFVALIGAVVFLALLFAIIRWRGRILQSLVSGKFLLSAWGVWALLVFLYCVLFGTGVSVGIVFFPPAALTIIYTWWQWVAKTKK